MHFGRHPSWLVPTPCLIREVVLADEGLPGRSPHRAFHDALDLLSSIGQYYTPLVAGWKDLTSDLSRGEGSAVELDVEKPSFQLRCLLITEWYTSSLRTTERGRAWRWWSSSTNCDDRRRIRSYTGRGVEVGSGLSSYQTSVAYRVAEEFRAVVESHLCAPNGTAWESRSNRWYYLTAT